MNTGSQMLHKATRWNVASMRSSLNSLAAERDNLRNQLNQMRAAQTRVGVNWQSPAGRQYQNRLTTDIRVLENIINQLEGRINTLSRAINEYEVCEQRVQNAMVRLPR